MQETRLKTEILPSSRKPDAVRVTFPGRRIAKVAVRRPVELRLAVKIIVAPVVVKLLVRLCTVALRKTTCTNRIIPERRVIILVGLLE